MNELSIFTGAGGGLLGSRLLGWRTVCAIELEPFCREVLIARQEDGDLEPFPIWDDAKTFDGKPWRGCVDIITAGFPCTPWSKAGQQRGEADDRNLRPDTIRIICEVRPEWILLENVTGLLASSHDYFSHILRDLAQTGFNVSWGCISAQACGAPHIRERLWIVGKREARRSASAEAGAVANTEQ